eukprot:scaffold53231_cov30-Tisochrysis_lutea.AAC.8
MSCATFGDPNREDTAAGPSQGVPHSGGADGTLGAMLAEAPLGDVESDGVPDADTDGAPEADGVPAGEA